jgi:tetratricopeptide (TPR) repeat protein
MRRLLLPALALLLALPAVAQEDSGEIYRKAMELFRAQKYEQALPLFRTALDLAEARYGEESPLLALDLNNLAEIYRLMGRHDEAEPLYRRAIVLDEAAGDDNPGLATSLNNLALLYRAQDRLKEAEPLYKRALVVLEKALGPSHPDVAKSLNNLAMLYRLQGAPEKAQPLQERALKIADEALGAQHPTTKLMRRNLELVSSPAAKADVAALEPAPATARPAQPPTRRVATTDAGSPPKPAASAPRPGASAAVPAPAPAPLLPPTPPPAPPKRAAAAPAPAPAPAARAPSGRFAVHVASVREPAAVGPEWRRLVGLHPGLAGLQLQPPQSVQIAGRGIYYRVAAGPFASRAQAQEMCNRLKPEGQYCQVIQP